MIQVVHYLIVNFHFTNTFEPDFTIIHKHTLKHEHLSIVGCHVGILSRKYSNREAVPLARMAGRGMRNGFPPNSRCLQQKKIFKVRLMMSK